MGYPDEQVEDFSFPWESVRKLKEFQDTMPIRNPRLRSSRRTPECATHGLPEEFIPVCKSPKAANIFERLASIAAEQRVCEICANVACSGC
ncbi:guanylin isoform X2 [Hemicordylus capensis]|uniref:guanylin isoform X2 n=1 Tax=Hemicordylus capensis TaxID=884348 RepID=UPI0023021B44|nr:guanylin isoform X2 [Hemicordylus capensis]